MVAPLEWGLGHATRCIPVIAELIKQQCTVIIAAEGATCILLKSEFPELTVLPLRGYRIKLGSNKNVIFFTMLRQFPKIVYTIYREHQWLKNAIKQYKIDAVISDNRFGMFNKNIASVYITHQLMIKTGNKLTDKIARRAHSFFIAKYTQCWVPDFEERSLAGELSHPVKMPRNVQYIGALSRFEKSEGMKKRFDLLITISGPEPQRTLFELLLLKNVEYYPGKVLMIRGLPGSDETLESKNSSVTIINHLAGKDLAEAMQQAGIVICRSGYTSVMDLAKLHKKAILIPTPGQAEQEYLAAYLMRNGIFFSTSQKGFDLSETLRKSSLFASAVPGYDMRQYISAIQRFVQLVRATT